MNGKPGTMEHFIHWIEEAPMNPPAKAAYSCGLPLTWLTAMRDQYLAMYPRGL